MKLFPSGKIYVKRTDGSGTYEFTGAYANWLGTTMVGKTWVGSRFIEALVRQFALLMDRVETVIKTKHNETVVKKRAGR